MYIEILSPGYTMKFDKTPVTSNALHPTEI